MGTYTRGLGQATAPNGGPAGGGGIGQSEGPAQGPPAPRGFCVRPRAFREFICAAGALQTIRRLLAGLRLDDAEDVDVRTEQVRNFIVAQPVPEAVAAELLESYRDLAAPAAEGGKPLPVVVWAPAVAGQPPSASPEGQEETHLTALCEEDLLRSVKECWASAWSAQALTDRVKRDVASNPRDLTVVVLAMVEPEPRHHCPP